MGILNRTIRQHVSKQEVTAKNVTDMLTQKLGDDYKVSFKAKGNLGKQMIGISGNQDSVLVIKNAYHRARVFVNPHDNPADGTKEWYFGFDTSEISPVLNFVGRETGIIGRLIIRLIYGDAEAFYNSIFEHIQKEYNTELRETKVGLFGAKGK